MPPKKIVKNKIVEEENNIEISDLNDHVFEDSPVESVKKQYKTLKQPILSSIYLPSSTKDTDKIQLIQAINNFTLKGEQLMESMRGFDLFKEHVAKLDILINAKKTEHEEMNQYVETSYSQKLKKLDSEYVDHDKELISKHSEMNKKLESQYRDVNKKLESQYEDANRKLQNEFKNAQIDVKQKLSEFKLKSCEELLKENLMVMVKSDDYAFLSQSITKANNELDDLKKSYNKDCDKVRLDEKNKYNLLYENEKKIMQLNANVTNAEMKAQVDQQIKEIAVLKSQIDNMKHELSEQRLLTKEVAQASAKGQISQTFGK